MLRTEYSFNNYVPIPIINQFRMKRPMAFQKNNGNFCKFTVNATENDIRRHLLKCPNLNEGLNGINLPVT